MGCYSRAWPLSAGVSLPWPRCDIHPVASATTAFRTDRRQPRVIRANSPRTHIGENWRMLMASTKRRYSKEEFARRGDAIYETNVRPHIKPEDDGKFVAIDIESGMYEMDEDELEAGNRLRARVPEAQIWIVRVGSRSVHRFGGRERRQTP